MKSLLTLILMLFFFKLYSQDSILVRFESSEKNVKIRFATKENKDSFYIEFKTTNTKNRFRKEFSIPRNQFVYNEYMKIYLYVKCKYWFGWSLFYIMDYPQKDIPIIIYESLERKHKYRYTYLWSNVKPLD